MSKETFIYWFKVVMALMVGFAFAMLGMWVGKDVVGKFDKEIGLGVGKWLAANSLSVLGILYQLNIRGSEHDTPESRKDLFGAIWKCNVFVIIIFTIDVIWDKLD